MHACWVGHSEGLNHQPSSFPIPLLMWIRVAVSCYPLVPLPISREGIWAEEREEALPSIPRAGL